MLEIFAGMFASLNLNLAHSLDFGSLVYVMPFASEVSTKERPLTPQQEAFKDAKFGMFIHWSLFSLPTGHKSWVSPEGAIEHFTADKFSARAWVDLAIDAGAKYITFTSKHHEGFCLFSSKLTDFTSINAPAKQDFLKLLASECHRREMPLFIYFSLPDLHHPSFKPGEPLRWAQYVDFLHGQVWELCTNYGKVAGFWFDPGPHHGPNHLYHLSEMEEMIHQLQPGALIMGRDFYESEHRIPILPGNMGYLNDIGEGDPRAMPMPGPDNWAFEVCDTINDSWQYNESDRNFKSTTDLIRKLVKIVGLGGNYLLNQGPMGSGEVQPEQAQRLREIGAWLKKNGKSIYGTRPVAMLPPSWGHAVSKGRQVYLHILEWQRNVERAVAESPLRASVNSLPRLEVKLSGLKANVESASLLSGEALCFRCEEDSITVYIPESARDAIDTIVVLNVDKALW